VLIHDSQLLSEAELASEGRFGHAVAAYAVELGAAAGAKTVALFHHRPDRVDAELDRLAESGLGPPQVIVAAQDEVLCL
jgi:ribonuclease BN (tRNA processing enzyme)